MVLSGCQNWMCGKSIGLSYTPTTGLGVVAFTISATDSKSQLVCQRLSRIVTLDEKIDEILLNKSEGNEKLIAELRTERDKAVEYLHRLVSAMKSDGKVSATSSQVTDFDTQYQRCQDIINRINQ